MTIYKIINSGQTLPAHARKRVWLFMGVPAIVAPDTTLMLLADRVDEKYLITFALFGAANARLVSAALPLKTWTDLTDMCAIYMLPRAVHCDAMLRPVSMLMEFAVPDVAQATLWSAKT